MTLLSPVRWKRRVLSSMLWKRFSLPLPLGVNEETWGCWQPPPSPGQAGQSKRRMHKRTWEGENLGFGWLHEVKQPCSLDFLFEKMIHCCSGQLGQGLCSLQVLPGRTPFSFSKATLWCLSWAELKWSREPLCWPIFIRNYWFSMGYSLRMSLYIISVILFFSLT